MQTIVGGGRMRGMLQQSEASKRTDKLQSEAHAYAERRRSQSARLQ